MARSKKCPLSKKDQDIALSEVRRIKYERECDEVVGKLKHHIHLYDKANPQYTKYTDRLMSETKVESIVYEATRKWAAFAYSIPDASKVVRAPDWAPPEWVVGWLLFLTFGSVLNAIAVWIKISGG